MILRHILVELHLGRNAPQVKWGRQVSIRNQDLRHGIFGGFAFFALIGLMYGLDKIYGVVIGNKLQGVKRKRPLFWN